MIWMYLNTNIKITQISYQSISLYIYTLISSPLVDSIAEVSLSSVDPKLWVERKEMP